MSNSFTFNSIDMSSYGLYLRNYDNIFTQLVSTEQLVDSSFAYNIRRPPREITLDVVVAASSLATLLSYLDSIKQNLNLRDEASLIINSITDRYWMAHFVSMEGMTRAPTVWEGTITLLMTDQAAYDNDETSSNKTIDADPKEVTETAGGTERVAPVWTLTCTETLTGTTVSIENEATGETIEWTGDLVSSDILEIDAANMTVKLNGVMDMGSVDGQFPHLVPGSNTINVAGFYSASSNTLNIAYRPRYV